MHEHRPRISIVVPARNSARQLTRLLDSCLESTYTHFEVVVNDSVDSSDETPQLVQRYADQGLTITYLQRNLSMAQARAVGAASASGNVLLHVDSDMQLSPYLLAECVCLLGGEYDALVIPEFSYGSSFWARCKALERATYAGSYMESLRCMTTCAYQSVGGHNSAMVFSEDKDFDLRIRAAKYRVGRTQSCLYHDEGTTTLTGMLRKKAFYANTANAFAAAHPEEFALQANVLARFGLYFKSRHLFRESPGVFSGMIALKLCEFGVSGLRYLWVRARNSSPRWIRTRSRRGDVSAIAGETTPWH